MGLPKLTESIIRAGADAQSFQRGQPIRLTRNEWLKARQLSETYWLYVVWDPTEADAVPVTIQNPGYALEHAAREVRAISHVELLAEVIEQTASVG